MVNNKKYVIGISCFYHDSSACLFVDGKLAYACEEEKFTGIKHDDRFPSNSINYIFNMYGIGYDDVSAVCFYEDPNLKRERIKNNYNLSKTFHFMRSMFRFNSNQKILSKELKKFTNSEIFYSKHHDSHLYYSAFSSDFKKSVVVSIDGVGETDSATIGVYDGQNIKSISIGEYPNSLGLFYSAMTAFLGFRPNEGEYKVMGLSAYGSYKKYIEPLRDLVKFEDGKIICNMDYFTWNKSHNTMFSSKLYKLLDVLPRIPDSELTSEYTDIACAVQKVYEELLFEILNHYSEIYEDIENICLGGGCAYNGLANGKIYENTKFKHIWIPPSPSDAGSSVGACINYIVNELGVKPTIPKTPFIGPTFNVTKSYKKKLRDSGVIYLEDDSLYKLIARELYRGKVIGWYRDEIEFGARALGNRSILADPSKPNMKERINKLIKKREGFRPFAPMVTKERQHEFFNMVDDIPYMNQVVTVKEEFRDKLPSITHVDGSARVQTVYKDNQIHRLLREFEKISSIPILLNTSFNIKDKTMVLTPEQAIQTLRDTDMDILVLQNILIFNNKK